MRAPPLATQPKLLRVLQEAEVLRVGALRPRRIDIRLVAATNAALDAAVASGRFRSDLYYRINGVVVTLPALRDRRGEILPLARRFAAAAARGRGHAAPAWTADAERALLAHDWPGNIRELRTAVERAVLFAAERGAIDAADLQLHPGTPPAIIAAPRPGTQPPAHERERIFEALQRAHGNQKEAAKLLGCSRQTLAKKLDAHAIGRPRKRG